MVSYFVFVAVLLTSPSCSITESPFIFRAAQIGIVCTFQRGKRLDDILFNSAGNDNPRQLRSGSEKNSRSDEERRGKGIFAINFAQRGELVNRGSHYCINQSLAVLILGGISALSTFSFSTFPTFLGSPRKGIPTKYEVNPFFLLTPMVTSPSAEMLL